MTETKAPRGRSPVRMRAARLIPRPSSSYVVNLMYAAVLMLAAATIIGLVELWPHHHLARPKSLGSTRTLAARVERVKNGPCAVVPSQRCQTITVKLLEGRDKGHTSAFEFTPTPGVAALRHGDRIRVIRNPPPPKGAPPTAQLPPYSFADFDRRLPMLWLGVAFVVLLLATGRLMGLRALVALAASLAVVLKFVIPAILNGRSAVGVALVGALTVMMIMIPLSYGLRAKAMAAWLGTAISLLLAVELASVFTHVAHLSGASSEEAVFLSATDAKISLQGLLLAGMVIGALGVLVDLTVSQASTVIALRRANPKLGVRQLFSGALEVGHDHIAATVSTLVFAYAGATLPVLLIFSIGGTTFTDGVNSEAVAEEIIAALVGSVGLIASLPITTALAALLAVRMHDKQLQDAHAHAH